MVNKKFWFRILVMALVFGITITSCTPLVMGMTSVPSWAQGTWYADQNLTVKSAEITSSQYISYQISGYTSNDYTVSELMRLDYTGANGDTVEFGGSLQGSALLVKRLSSSSQISIGTDGGMWVTLYK